MEAHYDGRTARDQVSAFTGTTHALEVEPEQLRLRRGSRRYRHEFPETTELLLLSDTAGTIGQRLDARRVVNESGRDTLDRSGLSRSR
jgi:hypothetical protein